MSARLTAKEERWLLNEMGELIALVGAEHFLSAPLIEPSDRFFPDRWQPNTDGVVRLAKRLLRYAGLRDIDVSVRDFVRVSQADDWGPVRPEHTGDARETIAWYAGFSEGGVARFGVAVDLITDPEMLVAAMSHEVAHAWRDYHDLVESDRDLEEKLTDLTTIYLGFGALTANAAYRYRSGTEYRGAQSYSKWQLNQAGYLSLDAMSFLLAAQARARGLSFWERRRITRLLEPNQAGAFSLSYRKLDDEDDLREVLSIPDELRGRRARRKPQRTAPRGQLKLVNLARHTQRIERDYRWFGLAAGLLLTGVAVFMLHRPLLEAVGAMGVGAVLGLLAGRLWRSATCALSDCRKPLHRHDISCGYCGAVIGSEEATILDATG